MIENIQYYREAIKAAIYSNMAAYKEMIQHYAAIWKEWIAIHVLSFVQNIRFYAAYAMANAQAYIAWAAASLYSGILRGLNAVVYGITHFPELLSWTLSKMAQGMMSGLRWFSALIQNGLDLGGRLLHFVLDVTTFLIRNAGNIAKFVFNHALDILELIGTFTKMLLEFVWHNAWALTKHLGGKALNFLGATVGIAYGLCSVVVDIAADLLTGTLSFAGIHIAQFAAFEALKTGLGVALTTYALYQAARLSYVGITALFTSSFVAQHFRARSPQNERMTGDRQYQHQMDNSQRTEHNAQPAVPFERPPAYTPYNGAGRQVAFATPSAPPVNEHYRLA